MSTSPGITPSAVANILVVDDDAELCSALEVALSGLGYAVETTTSPLQAADLVRRTPYAAVLTDLAMDEMPGLELCESIRAADPSVPIIILTGAASVDTAVHALRLGVRDYLVKPFNSELLQQRLSGALRLAATGARDADITSQTIDDHDLPGTSPVMERVRTHMQRFADSDSSLLILGETGTGKEVAARAIHARSARRNGPFLAINCAAIPAQLLESELFGHERGAFTDAASARKGLFREAHGGTLFLDEIGELPLFVQSKLLRALQERKVRPVGGTHEAEFDVRLMAATHRDLDAAVNLGEFRADLYYRINIVTLHMPALRERAGDILSLAQHFLNRTVEQPGRPLRLSLAAAARLVSYPWPGNVRELENCMQRAAVLAKGDAIELSDLPENVQSFEETTAHGTKAEVVPFEELERCYVLRVLQSLDGNMSLTSRRLGLDRRTLYRKVERYGGRTSEPVERFSERKRIEHALCELVAPNSTASR
jgi:two-component system response regulator HydG